MFANRILVQQQLDLKVVSVKSVASFKPAVGTDSKRLISCELRKHDYRDAAMEMEMEIEGRKRSSDR